MTKHKNLRAQSAAQRKFSGPAATRGRKFASGGAPRFQQLQRRDGQSWGRNNRDLSYQASQQKRASPGTSSFSSFFAPSKSQYEQPRVVELGLLIRKHWVGGLIGKKGRTIWEIRNRSNGANIDFGNDDILIDRSKDRKWNQSPWPESEHEKFTVCAISGSKEQATEAAKVIAEQVAEAAQSSDYRLEFLIPSSYVGIFIGRKGTNIQQMKGSDDSGVSINIRDQPILLGNNETTLCTLFGPAESMKKTVEAAANWLGDISIRVQMDRDAEQLQ